jgi:hypothetical protein
VIEITYTVTQCEVLEVSPYSVRISKGYTFYASTLADIKNARWQDAVLRSNALSLTFWVFGFT